MQRALQAIQEHTELARLVVSAQQYLVTWADTALEGQSVHSQTIQKAEVGLAELASAKERESEAFESLLSGMGVSPSTLALVSSIN